MSTDLATTNGAAKLEQALIIGDLASLSDAERIAYYGQVCASLSLNPLTKPFEYLKLNGKLVLYAKRDATDQLRKLHGVSITRLERERLDDVYVVTAYATTKDGRTDSSIGAVAVGGLKGEFLANAYMKAESKSKRRVTLSICGLGLLDELEVETIPGATTVPAETVTVTREALPATSEREREAETAPPDEEAEYVPLTEDQLTQLFDLIRERTGSPPSEVALAVGQPLSKFLQVHRLTGKQFLLHWRAFKRDGTPVPGAPPAMTPESALATNPARGG